MFVKSRILLEEAASMLPIRRALVVVVLFVPWMQLGLTLVANRDELSGQFWAFYAYTAFYVLVAAVTSKRGYALAAPLLPLIIMTLPWFLEGESWVNVNVAAMASVILFSLILRFAWALAHAIAITAYFLIIVNADLPTTLQTGALMASGTFHVIQLMATVFVVSSVWTQLNKQALLAQEKELAKQRDLVSMRLRHDRFAHWRRVASRIHGDVLELIARARSGGSPTGTGLSQYIADLRNVRALSEPLPRLVVDEVAADFAGRLNVEFVADSASRDAVTDMASAELLRDMLMEFCIVARHSGAGSVYVQARINDQRSTFVLSTDLALGGGLGPLYADFGVVRQQVKAAGASLTLGRDSDGQVTATLVIPTLASIPVEEPQESVQWGTYDAGGRILVAVMQSVMIAGIAVAVWLNSQWPNAYWVALVLAVTNAGLIAAFWTAKERLNVWQTAVLASLAVGLVSLTAQYAPQCTIISPVHYIANSSGYVLLALIFVGNQYVAGVGLVAWLAASAGLIEVLPDECESVAWYAIVNTLVLAPFGLIVWFVATRTFRSLQTRRQALAEQRKQARITDEMIEDTVAEIERLLLHADDLLGHMAMRPVDDELLNKMRIIESQLRIRAQVDPVVGGATARTLIAFVDEIAQRGNWIDIGTIASSEYHRELPEEVLRAATKIAHIIGSGRRINFFTTEQDEIVSHTLTRAEAEQVADLFAEWEMTNSGWACEDVQVDLDLQASDDPAAPVLIVWSRPIQRVPGLGIPDRRAHARV